MTRRFCLGLFSALVSTASAWEGWHPNAWTNWRGSVETVAVYATAHSTTLTNWTSPTTSTTFVEAWLANIAFYTNNGITAAPGPMYSNTWKWTLSGPTSAYTNVYITVTNQTPTNIVVTSRDIMALDVTLAMQERQQALRFPRGTAPRFLRDNRECLVEAKETMRTSLVSEVYWNTGSVSWVVTDGRHYDMAGHWIDHLGLSTPALISAMASNALQGRFRSPTYYFTNTDTIVPRSYDSENLHPGNSLYDATNTAYLPQGFPSMVVTQLVHYANVPSNYLDYTPWRALNGLGASEGRIVTTSYVCTWGGSTQTVTDYHGGSHSLAGANGQIFQIASTSAYVQAGWREGDYGWPGIRREITNLFLSTSKTMSANEDHHSVVWYVGGFDEQAAAFLTWESCSNAFTNVWARGGGQNNYAYSADPFGVTEPCIRADVASAPGQRLPLFAMFGCYYPFTNSFTYGFRPEGWSSWINFTYDSGVQTNIQHVAHLLVGINEDLFTEPDYTGFSNLAAIAASGTFGEYLAVTNYVASSTGECTIGWSSFTNMPAFPASVPATNGPAVCRGFAVDWAGWLIDWTATTNGLKYR